MTAAVDYFEALGVDRKLSLDTALLQRNFYERSRQLHPDRYATRSQAEQQYALDATALLNDAYRVLREPVSRAEYLLKQEGFDIGEQRSKDVPPELLEEVFELNMMLESTPDRAELGAARERFLLMMATSDTELESQSASFDRSGDKAILQNIRGILNRRRYIGNLIRDVNRALEQ